METDKVEGTGGLSNVVYLPCAVDDDGLERFIRTCDAMLHGRAEGEAFGQAAARFDVHGLHALPDDRRI